MLYQRVRGFYRKWGGREVRHLVLCQGCTVCFVYMVTSMSILQLLLEMVYILNCTKGILVNIYIRTYQSVSLVK